MRVSAFSDLIAFSVSVKTPDVYSLVMRAAQYYKVAAKFHFFVRGAISIGTLTHTDDEILGPALAVLLALAVPARGAMPAAEKLLPDETLVLVTVPDWSKLSAIYRNSAYGRFWSDPAMKPVKDHFMSRWQGELVQPLERELGISLDTYASRGVVSAPTMDSP